MPIDRVLSVEGRGLVVAGTPWTGGVAVGSTLQLAGTASEFRVRDLEIHGRKSDVSECGRRTAVNLVGHHSRPLRRGDELVDVGSHQPAQRFVVSLELAPRTPRLKMPLVAQLHTATRAVSCRLLGPRFLDVNDGTREDDVGLVVLVEVEEPIVGTVDQACIIRLPYPVGSIGGGRILASLSDPRLANMKTRELLEFGVALRSASPAKKLMAWCRLLGELEPTEHWWAAESGQPKENLEGAMKETLQSEYVQIDHLLVSEHRLSRVESRIERLLGRQAEQADNAWLKQEALVERCKTLASSKVIEFCLKRMSAGTTTKVVELNGLLALASEQTQLSKKQRARMLDMVRIFEGNRTPPNSKELAAMLKISQEATLSLQRHAAQQGVLIELEEGLYLHSDVFRSYVEELRVAFAESDVLSVPAIKDMWGVTRKLAIPLLEYCDRQEVTARVEEGRAAGASL